MQIKGFKSEIVQQQQSDFWRGDHALRKPFEP
jgi:hypothetical protein